MSRPGETCPWLRRKARTMPGPAGEISRKQASCHAWPRDCCPVAGNLIPKSDGPIALVLTGSARGPYRRKMVPRFLALTVAVVAATSAAQRAPEAPRTAVILLGTGTPVPDPGAWGPAI